MQTYYILFFPQVYKPAALWDPTTLFDGQRSGRVRHINKVKEYKLWYI